MKELFDQISEECSKNVTKSYSTSFSLATKNHMENKIDIALIDTAGRLQNKTRYIQYLWVCKICR